MLVDVPVDTADQVDCVVTHDERIPASGVVVPALAGDANDLVENRRCRGEVVQCSRIVQTNFNGRAALTGLCGQVKQ